MGHYVVHCSTSTQRQQSSNEVSDMCAARPQQGWTPSPRQGAETQAGSAEPRICTGPPHGPTPPSPPRRCPCSQYSQKYPNNPDV